MSNRTHSILFHLHTVSGIVISVLLFVIFFAGSFSFFRDEIVNWERNHTVSNTENIELDFDAALDALQNNYNLCGRDIAISKYYIERRVGINLSGSKDTLANEESRTAGFFYLDTQSFKKVDYESSYSLGEFLYRLHFFAQIPYPAGYYLSGFVAFFFLFAIVTGILVHWKKIVSNFYVFRPWAKLKTVWTDAHTALGTLGLPFQFVYAVTGAFFMIKVVLVAPGVFALYSGDQAKMYADLGYEEPFFSFENKTLPIQVSINDYVEEVRRDWHDFDVKEVHIFNYGDENMHVVIEGALDWNTKFTAPGERIYKASTGQVVEEVNPYSSSSYLEGVKNVLYRLHFGDYGGYALKIISFLLGLVSCFVIISGVMIWLTARDKKSVHEKRKRFNEWVVNIYLGVCLSMYPVTAVSFIAVKLVDTAGMRFLYQFYFLTWLALSVFFIIKKDNYFTNKYTLLSGSIIGFFIPVVNGITTGNWLWISFSEGHVQLFFVDAMWLVLSVLGCFAVMRIMQNEALK